MKSPLSTVALVFGLLFSFLVVVYSLQGPELARNILYLSTPLIAVLAGIYATRTYHLGNVHGTAMALLTAGLLCFFIGESLFSSYQFIWHIDPYPSLADIFYLAAYPLIFAGLIKEVSLHKLNWHRMNRLVLVLICLLLAAFTVIITYFGVFLAYNPGDPLINNLIAISYGIGDLILIVPALFVMKLAAEFKGGKLFNAWTLVLIALLTMMTADILYAIYKDGYNAVDWPYIMIDIIWGASYLLFAYAFFYTGAIIHAGRDKLRSLQK